MFGKLPVIVCVGVGLLRYNLVYDLLAFFDGTNDPRVLQHLDFPRVRVAVDVLVHKTSAILARVFLESFQDEVVDSLLQTLVLVAVRRGIWIGRSVGTVGGFLVLLELTRNRLIIYGIVRSVF